MIQIYKENELVIGLDGVARTWKEIKEKYLSFIKDIFNPEDFPDFKVKKTDFEEIIYSFDKEVIEKWAKHQEKYQTEFKNCDKSQCKQKKVEKKKYEIIVEALGYSTLRTNYGFNLVNMLGIKSCPYCNAQFISTVEKEIEHTKNHGKQFKNIDRRKFENYLLGTKPINKRV